MSYSGLKNIE
jgi:hypothetical protein